MNTLCEWNGYIIWIYYINGMNYYMDILHKWNELLYEYSGAPSGSAGGGRRRLSPLKACMNTLCEWNEYII